jgi:hypothetical protein
MISPSVIPTLTRISTPPRDSAPLARLPRRRKAGSGGTDLAIRFAKARDAGALHELQELDGRSLPEGAHLVAELGGITVAAIAVTDDTVVADPFQKTAAVVDLLRIRARQLRIADTPCPA